MKVINSLIAVEVMKGTEAKVSGSVLRYYIDSNHVGGTDLPFPAEIIGLASGIKELQTDDFMNTTTIVFNAAGRDYQSWADIYNDLGILPTPTTDIIFLRKKL